VTGALRRNFQTARATEADSAPMAAPMTVSGRERYAEEGPHDLPRPSVRPAGDEDIGLEIPTFLRRQTS
jgi:hypothetical protein